MDIQFYIFLISARHARELSAQRPYCIFLEGKISGTVNVVNLVHSHDLIETEEKKFVLVPESEPHFVVVQLLSQSVFR
jgi:hypothetical protein